MLLGLASFSLMALSLAFSSCFRSPEEKSAGSIRSTNQSLERKDYDRAVIELLNATQETPKTAEAHYLLGEAFLKKQQAARALQAYKIAAELEPGRTDAHLRIAQILGETSDKKLLAAAPEHAQTALHQRANDPDALQALAVTEWRKARPNSPQVI